MSVCVCLSSRHAAFFFTLTPWILLSPHLFMRTPSVFQLFTPSLLWLWSLNPICVQVMKWPWLAWPTAVILRPMWFGRTEVGAIWRTTSLIQWWPTRKGCSLWLACSRWCWSPTAPTAAGWSIRSWAKKATHSSQSQVGDLCLGK